MRVILGIVGVVLLMLQGCTAVNTFPTVARAGDTVSVMIGGSENARKDTVDVILTDSNLQQWDLQSLGLVRSVFNLRADARSEGMHYSSYLESYSSWSKGHEPVQTVLVVDIPSGVALGNATLMVDTHVTDDSSGFFPPYTVNIEVISGTGVSDSFDRRDSSAGILPVDFEKLEPAPHAKISFGTDGSILGAVSLIIDFDESIVNPDDLNIYVPESTVRGSFISTGSFGEAQRMVYWRQDGQQLYIDVTAPQGIKTTYLMIYIVHPRGLEASPGLSLVSSQIYDIDGNEIVLMPSLEYFQ